MLLAFTLSVVGFPFHFIVDTFLLLAIILSSSIRSGDGDNPPILKLVLPLLSSGTLSCRLSKDASANRSEFLFNVAVVF